MEIYTKKQQFTSNFYNSISLALIPDEVHLIRSFNIQMEQASIEFCLL